MTIEKAFIGMPMHTTSCHPSAAAGMHHALAQGASYQGEINASAICNSSLPYCFDMLWCNARNMGADYFAMIHSDVCPHMGWFNILYDELQRTGADLVSAVVPIKNVTGMTSTGIDDTGNIWHPRRLTLHEVFKLDETFTDPQLLCNTGLFICRLKRPWNKEPIGFKQLHKIEVNEHTGVWEPSFIPEDWDFSRQLRARGVPHGNIYATRKVKLFHDLEIYNNYSAWGQCKTDPVCRPADEKKEAA